VRGALIRIGLSALGLVYVAMGVVSARVAFLGARNREEGVPGALRFLLEQPYGSRVLGAVVAGLLGIAIVSGIESATGRRKVPVRIGLAVNAIGYAALAWTSARLLLHLGSGGPLEQTGVAWLLNVPGGGAILEVIGGVVILAAIVEIVQGIRGPSKPARPPKAIARGLAAVARFGLMARGMVLAAVGYFLLRAARESDPRNARTVGGVLKAFTHTSLGPWFVGVIALGLAAYGVHLWTLALWRRRV
jgi:hypothetical protein